MAFVRYALAGLGVVLCLIGVEQMQAGIPRFHYAQGIAGMRSDPGEILLGIAWLLGALASGALALTFAPAETPP